MHVLRTSVWYSICFCSAGVIWQMCYFSSDFALSFLISSSVVCLGVAEASITLMLISLRRRIQVAIAFLREASKYGSHIIAHTDGFSRCWLFVVVFRAITHITSTLFYPLITFLMLTICIVYWALTAAYPSVLTTNDIEQTHTAVFGSCFDGVHLLSLAIYQLVNISLTTTLKPAALHPLGNQSIRLFLLKGTAPLPTVHARLRYEWRYGQQ